MATAKPVSKPADNLNDAYSQLDKMVEPQQEEVAPGDEPQAEAGSEGGETPEENGKDGKNENDGIDASADGKPPKAKTLRQTLETTKAEFAKYKAETTKELETLRKSATAPKDDPEKVKLTETLAQREKRLNELEEELSFVAFERTAPYKREYETPFVEAYNAGRSKVAAIKVDDGQGNLRPGTPEDFDRFMRVTDDDAAADLAEQMFGNRAPSILFHRERVQELNNRRTKALDEHRTSGGAREKARAEALTNRQKQLAGIWETEIKTASEKYGWFKPVDGDDSGNGLLEQGMKWADLAFGKEVKDGDGKPIKLSQEEMAKLHAAIRNKAGGFDRQVHANGQLKKQIKDLKKQLAEFEGSVPGPGQGKGKQGAPLSTWDQVEADLAKRTRR